MKKHILLFAAAIVLGCGVASAQEQTSFKDAIKAAKEAKKWAKENPEEAAKYQQQTNQQAKEALQRTQQAIKDANVAGMYDSQAAQGTLGNEYAAGASAAKKAAEARFKATPKEVLVPEGPGYTNTGTPKKPSPKYNDKSCAMEPVAFTPGTKAIIDWAKGLVPASKWVYRQREYATALNKPAKVVKFQGKQALALTDSEVEPDLGTEYMPECFSLEFDVWTCPSTANLPQDYSDNFVNLMIWGDINSALMTLHFSPNTPGPHKFVDGYEFSWSSMQLHSRDYDEWAQADTKMKANTWTHIAISCNKRDVSVYVNGQCHACYNRAYLYGMPRVFWLQSQHFRNKTTYVANFKLYEY